VVVMMMMSGEGGEHMMQHEATQHGGNASNREKFDKKQTKRISVATNAAAIVFGIIALLLTTSI
jgi:hypothetical protein